MIHLHTQKKLFTSCKDTFLDINLDIKNRTFLAISGESGAGKTTFLRVLAGLEKSKSEIIIDGEIWQNKKIFLPPQKRKIGFVFQDYALFPNMSVLQNLLYIKNDEKKADKLLQMCNLHELKNRLPDTLSGGQKQRVGLCRALMRDIKILLLDEALSALDFEMRTTLQDEIKAFHDEFNITTFMVTHEPSEIYKLANQIIVLKDGVITKKGTPKEVLLHTKGSQKFSFYGQILDIKKIDVIFVAIIAIGQQIVEVVISEGEATSLHVGDKVSVSTKAFAPTISK